jgi:hypothetical protein
MSVASPLPILCLDFDGVIHRYSDGWRNGEIYDPPTDGFWAWAAEAQHHFRLVVYSSRCATREGQIAIDEWLRDQARAWQGEPVSLELAAEKPPAFLTIDDRCVRFDGAWDADELAPDVLRSFRPWMHWMRRT